MEQHIEFGDGSAASAALAEAFEHFARALDDFDPSEIRAAAAVVSVPDGRDLRESRPPSIGRSQSWIRVVQRTVKAGGRLHLPTTDTTSPNLHKLHERPRMGRGRSLWKGVEDMIVATRDGELIQQEQLSPEQKDAAFLAIFRAFLSQHPETVQTGGQGAADAGTSSV